MYPSTFKKGFREKDLMSGPIEETNYGYALAKINIAFIAIKSINQFIFIKNISLSFKLLKLTIFSNRYFIHY